MITRRTFIHGTAASLLAPLALQARQAPPTLPNGITLASPWPPVIDAPGGHATRPPYLDSPPEVIPIDTGRQLFVDDFLIDNTALRRTFHNAVYHPASPVLVPRQEWEIYDAVAARTKQRFNPSAMAYSDGVFYDPGDRTFKLWYMAGYGGATCLAMSSDGISWEKPHFDIRPGTNAVHLNPRDSATMWLDHFAGDRSQRFKMAYWYDGKLVLSVSPDGIHWTDIGDTGPTKDRSTFFYNPFRRVWCFSLRADQFVGSISGRYRRYWEAAEFSTAKGWAGREPVAWIGADGRDTTRPELAAKPELYNLDGVGYESLMLGLFTIWRGESPLREKINEIEIGFSRDGFHWDRPNRSTFLGVSDTPGAWNWGNVQSAGGCCLVVGEQLYFYVSGRQGRPRSSEPGVCSTGLATLRRDGFASMDWLPEGATPASAGVLTTRPVRFSGRHLFVNADVQQGELRAEVLDRAGQVIPAFAAAACVPVSGNGTKMAVRWNGTDLAALAGQPVRFRFSMTRGRLYAFWVSPRPSGESLGYPGAGGPQFSGPVDA